jgi:integrator complex subunit 11
MQSESLHSLTHSLTDCVLDQYPTKAICPILLEDYRKITVERKGETNFFTSQDIKNCMKKGISHHTRMQRLAATLIPSLPSSVIGVNIHQTIRVDDELEIKAFYAGHVGHFAMAKLGTCASAKLRLVSIHGTERY